MKNIKIANLFNIPVYLNWTFVLLLAIVFGYAYVESSNFLASVITAIAVSVIFSFIIIHEFSHALTARKYGVKTESITVYFIGGLAQLERIPKGKLEEFWVAVAGPLSNVVLAGIFIGLGVVLGETISISPSIETEPLMFLAWFNLLIAGFNLLPAFPMDGGRVLRSLFATKFDYVSATKYASYIGRFFAILFIMAGIYMFHFMLVFIGFFVYLGATAEYHKVESDHKDAELSRSENEESIYNL